MCKKPPYFFLIILLLAYLSINIFAQDTFSLKFASPVSREFKSYIALGQENKARELYFEALEINRENKDRYASAETLYNLAQLENRVGDLETARQYIRQAINISEIIRAELFGKNQRSSYLTIWNIQHKVTMPCLNFITHVTQIGFGR